MNTDEDINIIVDKIVSLYLLCGQLMRLAVIYKREGTKNVVNTKEVENIYTEITDEIDLILDNKAFSNLKKTNPKPYITFSELKNNDNYNKFEESLNGFSKSLGDLFSDPKYSIIDPIKTINDINIKYQNIILRTDQVDLVVDINFDSNLKDVTYDKIIFILKVTLQYLSKILKVSSGGDFISADYSLNTKYVKLRIIFNKIITREDIKSKFEEIPSIPEDLFEDMGDRDIAWKYSINPQINNYIGKVETEWIIGGEKEFYTTGWFYELVKDIDELVSNHKKALKKRSDEIFKKIEEKRDDSLYYITKIGEDFSFNGKILKISKTNQQYTIFSVLYNLIPDGGEISYGDLIEEIKKIKKFKSKTYTEIKKIISMCLTDNTNSFFVINNIKGQSDSKPIIDTKHGYGIVFNNKI